MKTRDMLRLAYPVFTFAVGSVAGVMGIVGIGMRLAGDEYAPPTYALVMFMVSAAFFFLMGIGALYLSSKGLPIAYNVAIIGYPRSGKTTLITSIFGELFARRIQGVDSRPTGQSTIERVNTDLARLANGMALGPTTDQDRFAYRTNIRLGKVPFKRTYKVEFGDFPGDDSQRYLDNYGPWLHTTPFFKWVSESDALVFVVDIGVCIVRGLPVREDALTSSDLSAAIRAAWQKYVDVLEGGERAARNTPVVLAFTKADMIDLLLLARRERVLSILRRQEITDKYQYTKLDFRRIVVQWGLSQKLPPKTPIDPVELEEARRIIETDFADLIKYLQNETRRFQIVYTSCTGVMDGRRLGLAELLKAVLPR